MNPVKPVFRILEQTHQPTMLELLNNYTPFQLLVMTMLSARTKDTTTIPIVKEMFKNYPHPKDYVNLPVEKIEQLIYRVGFHRVKAKHLKQLSRIIQTKYQGKVPETFEELILLPGIGRKTANCILNYAFNKSTIAVDIHVHRIANRLGWIDTKTPEETEQELQRTVPREEWINANKLLVGHGQTICSPIKPKCDECAIKRYCNYGLRGKIDLLPNHKWWGFLAQQLFKFSL
ncbi:endonuclease III [Candidatus Woesearchaeota archaeon]|nr:endonuclease III [Candidatus Woesearchaeota archaeon]